MPEQDPLVERAIELSKRLEEVGKKHDELTKQWLLKIESLSPDDRETFLRMVYDRFAENYDDYMTETRHFLAIKRMLAAIVAGEMVKSGAFSSRLGLDWPVLDPSCGTGHVCKILVEQMQKLKLKKPKTALVLNDLSPKMIQIAKGKNFPLGRRKINFHVGNFQKLADLYPNHFKTVIISQTLHIINLDERKILAKTIDKILQPGGILILLEEFPWQISRSSLALIYVEKIASPMDNLEMMNMTFFPYAKLFHLNTVIDEFISIDYQCLHVMHALVLKKPFKQN